MILLTDQENTDTRTIEITQGHPLYWNGPLPLYRAHLRDPVARKKLNDIYLLNRDGIVYLKSDKVHPFMEDIRREVNKKSSEVIGTPKAGEILLSADMRLESYDTFTVKSLVLKANHLKEGWLLEPDLILDKLVHRLQLDRKNFATKHRKHVAEKETRLLITNVSPIDGNNNLSREETERYLKLRIDLLTSPLNKDKCNTSSSRVSAPWE